MLGQIRARLTVLYVFFHSGWVFSFADGFFVRTVNSDCLADQFDGRLEIFTIRHRGWLCGSNHRRLGRGSYPNPNFSRNILWLFETEKKLETTPFFMLPASQYIPFPPGKQSREAPTDSPHQNKDFINYVFCRNWAVRKPAGIRLDSLAW